MLFLLALCLSVVLAEREDFASLCELGADAELTYPQDGVCDQADQGPFCVPPSLHNVAGKETSYFCGCLVDGDCFNQGNFPACEPEPNSIADSEGNLAGICDSCRERGDGTDTSKGSNSFCRLRYPSVDFFLHAIDEELYFGEDPSTGNKLSSYPPGEAVVPYREFCSTPGTCKPCFEASGADAALPSINFPDYVGRTLDAAGTISVDANLDASLKGTFFCHGHSIYSNGPDSVTHLGQEINYSFRPICAAFNLFRALGISGDRSFREEKAWGLGTVTMNTMDIDGDVDTTTVEAAKASYRSYDREQNTRFWSGACIPCRFPNENGVETKYHGLCYMSLNNNPICGDNGNCGGCTDNPDCAFMTDVADCWTDGSGSCTGTGYNCYKDGGCRDCRVVGCDNDVNDQTECDDADGICKTKFVWNCDGNDGAGGEFACSNANSAVSGFTNQENCQEDGSCKRCSITRSATSVQRSDAVSTCGVLDGPPGDNANQVNCRGNVCVNACTNGDPDDQSQCTGTQGANCMKDGICLDCNSDTDCVNNDLGDHPICDTDKICKPAFKCDGNAGAGTASACDATSDIVNEENCQEDGACLRCSVSRTNDQDTSYQSLSSTCGVLDGPPGDNANQKNCNSGTGVCVAECTAANGDPSNTYCRGINPQNPNCMDNGVCLRCHSDQDCINNDMGGQTVCDNDGICYPPFTCDGNIDDGTADSCTTANGAGTGRENCQSNGQCERCSVSRSSTTCSGSDGIGGGATGQSNCQVSATNGNREQHTCIDACTNGDFNDQSYCVGTQGANCMSDGRCFDCLSDDDCAANDMGGHPICDTDGICKPGCEQDFDNDCPTGQNCMENGRCRSCTDNADCIANDGPPNNGMHTECKSGVCRFPFCLSNADCVGNSDGPNCGRNGQCYDCRSVTGCGSPDGPDQIDGHVGDDDQPNCDADTGICVYYCTEDSDCQLTHKSADLFNHPCEPFCNVDRGCCVECMTDADCPHAGMTNGEKLAWRDDELAYTECSENHICVIPNVCDTDSDCTTSGSPACLVNEQRCVACTSDAHCGTELPACNAGSNTCEQCTVHAHCGSGYCAGGACYECLVDDHCPGDDVCRGSSCEDDSDVAVLPVASFITFLACLLFSWM